MRSDPAPLFVNLLVYYESKWLKKMKKTDMRRATRISNIFRLTLLFDLNDSGEFERKFWEILSPELDF